MRKKKWYGPVVLERVSFGMSVAGKEMMEFEGRIKPYVVITCTLAASGGLMFGYTLEFQGHTHSR